MRFLVAILGAAALLPAAAQADPARPYPGAGGTNVAGDRLVWSDSEGNLRAQNLAGGPPRTIHEGRLVGGAESLDVTDLEPGASRIAFITTATADFATGSNGWTTVRSGPLDGPFPIVAGREQDSGDPPLEDVSIYDGGIVYLSQAAGGEHRVIVQPDGAPPRTLLRSSEILGVAAGGGIVAVQFTSFSPSPTRVEVLDIATGRRLFGLDHDVAEMTVAADGTLLALSTDGELWWASPAAPAVHPIAHNGLQLGGLANGTAVFSADIGRFAVVRAADLATGAVRDVTPLLAELLLGLGAWDGAHFAYHDGACVIAGDLPAAPPPTIPTGPGCPRPAMRTDDDVAARRGRVVLTARCPGGRTEHCTGTARITGKLRGRTRTLASKRFDLTGGESDTYTLTVRRSLLRRVGSRADRRRGVHRARLVIRMTAGRVDDRVRSVTFRS
jgi:hypothetical protein